MDERYPIGETASITVAVLRHERREAGYPMWSAAIGPRTGEATVHVPGHYPGVLAQRVRAAGERFAPGMRLARDEYLDLTALARDADETLALSSTRPLAGARHRRGAAGASSSSSRPCSSRRSS